MRFSVVSMFAPMLVLMLFLSVSVMFPAAVSGQGTELPAPQKTGGTPLFDAISGRLSVRTFAEKDVPLPALSTILWSAYGFNREDKRVIPTPLNKQHLSVYVFLKDAVYLYDAKTNKLIKKADGDHRKLVGMQDYVFSAPVNLLYIADNSVGMETATHISVGCAAQDVYLACGSLGLGCVIRTGGVSEHAAELRKVLKLTNRDEPIAAQTIGYVQKAEDAKKN